MKEIIVNSKTYGQKKILLDKDDYEKLSKYKWSVVLHGKCFYAFRNHRNEGISLVYIHRLILNICHPKYRHIHVDHKNGNGLDNRKSNLRLSNQHSNLMNRGANKNNTTGFKGVHNTRNGKYRVSITFKRKYIWGGVFLTAIEAANKYNELAKKYFGEFAKLNNI